MEVRERNKSVKIQDSGLSNRMDDGAIYWHNQNEGVGGEIKMLNLR